MAIFAIISQAPRPEITERLNGLFGAKMHKFSDSSWIVIDEGTAKQVAEKIGAGKEGDIRTSVIVLTLTGSYWGRAQTETWDWLRDAVQGGANG